MLRLPNHEIASHTRPSLLIRYLMAIGPGTIIVKKAAEGTRNDGTSCELLQYHLAHYSYLALPDGHYPFLETDVSKKHREALVLLNKENAANDEDLQAYIRHKPIAKDVFKRWAESDWKYQSSNSNEQWTSWLENKVFVPESGPIIIVGSPESYLSYQCPFGEDKYSTPFRRLLSEAGYSAKYRLEMSVYGGAIHHGTVRTPLDRADSSLEHDIGLIFMGRTPAGRTVVVLAGATCPFGTFAAVRLATDYGRNEINSMAMEFFEGNSTNHCATAFFAKRVRRPDQLRAFGLQDPVGIDFIDQMRPASTRSDLAYRRIEVELQRLDTTPAIPSAQSTALSNFLCSKGPVNIITKWYPHDLRDDANAMQILEYSLDDSINYPVAAEITDYFEEHLGGHKANGQEIYEQLKKFNNEKCSPIVDAIRNLDDETTKLFKIWADSLEQRLKVNIPTSYSAWLDQYYRLPSDGATIVLGSPESFLGFEHVLDNAPKTKFAALFHSAQYPNRYQLRLEIKGKRKFIGIFDHKKRRVREGTSVARPRHAGLESDAGFISLCKGANGRDILAIVGISWLGTLAGVRLLFTQQRPSIDALMQAYARGERNRVDIYFTCNRTTHTRRTNDQNALWQNFDDPKDLEINTHDSELEPEFQRNHCAEKLFANLFAALDDKQKLGAIAIDQEKDFFRMSLSREGRKKRKLTIECQRPVFMGSKDPILCGSQANTVFRQLAYCVKQDSIRLNKGAFCGKYFVLGAPGVGKESVAQFVYQELAELKKNSRLFTVNSAGVASGLVLSELFGHVKGAFSGATENREGRFHAANGGVVFLDEFAAQHVTDNDLQEEREATRLQTTLLRVMESYTYSPVGSDSELTVNCLFVAATNIAHNKTELKSLIKRGYFRQDIRDRFEGRIFELPRLADRPMEILPGFIQKIRAVYLDLDKTPPQIEMSVEAIKLLLMQQLPANFRDLVTIAKAIIPKLDQDYNLASNKKPLQIRAFHLLQAMDEEEFRYPQNHPDNEMVMIEILVNKMTLEEVGVKISEIKKKETDNARKSTPSDAPKAKSSKKGTKVPVLPTHKRAKEFVKFDPKSTGYNQSGGGSQAAKDLKKIVEYLQTIDWLGAAPSDSVKELLSKYNELTAGSSYTSQFQKMYCSVLCYFDPKPKAKDAAAHPYEDNFSIYYSSKEQVDKIIDEASKLKLSFDFLAIAMTVYFGIEIRNSEYKTLCFKYRMLKDEKNQIAFKKPSGEIVNYNRSQIRNYIDGMQECRSSKN